jgi:hypothetical protein
MNLCKVAVSEADNRPPSRVSIIGGPSVIISEVTPRTLRILTSVRRVESSPKGLQTNLVSCKFRGPPNQGVPCAASSAVSLSTPICHRCFRRQLRARVVLISIYERRLQQVYTAFVKLFLDAEVSESVTTCFALHCCHSFPHEYLNLCGPSLTVTWLVALLFYRPDQ